MYFAALLIAFVSSFLVVSYNLLAICYLIFTDQVQGQNITVSGKINHDLLYACVYAYWIVAYNLTLSV